MKPVFHTDFRVKHTKLVLSPEKLQYRELQHLLTTDPYNIYLQISRRASRLELETEVRRINQLVIEVNIQFQEFLEQIQSSTQILVEAYKCIRDISLEDHGEYVSGYGSVSLLGGEPVMDVVDLDGLFLAWRVGRLKIS